MKCIKCNKPTNENNSFHTKDKKQATCYDCMEKILETAKCSICEDRMEHLLFAHFVVKGKLKFLCGSCIDKLLRTELISNIPPSKEDFIELQKVISKLSKKTKNLIPIEDIVAEACDVGITFHKVEEIIEQMKKEGKISEPKRGFIKRK